MNSLSKEKVLSSQPPEWRHSLIDEIRESFIASQEGFVVLDDDPTGTQTVRNLPVLTDWDTKLLTETLASDKVFFVLTNSRSMTEPDAASLNREIARNLREAADATHATLRLASRSDSTLRGHFPAEIDAIAEGLSSEFDGCIVAPFFDEGRRVTFDDTHWIESDGFFVPVGTTEYAKDSSFGYENSFLPRWIEEKSKGRWNAKEVRSVTLEDIRRGGPDRVTEVLEGVEKNDMIIVNALSYRDIEVAVAGILRAEDSGMRFIYRCAASFVRVRAGLDEAPLLQSEDLNLSDKPRAGLIVCGSYVSTSTLQVQAALALPGVEGIEVDVRTLYGSNSSSALSAAADTASRAISSGRNALLYTSRDLVIPAGQPQLAAARAVSDALVEIARAVAAPMRFVVVKGGITSSELATKSFGIRVADVLGQIAPGISVWKARQGPLAGIPYVVFPGNVGSAHTLADVIKKLS